MPDKKLFYYEYFAGLNEIKVTEYIVLRETAKTLWGTGAGSEIMLHKRTIDTLKGSNFLPCMYSFAEDPSIFVDKVKDKYLKHIEALKNNLEGYVSAVTDIDNANILK